MSQFTKPTTPRSALGKLCPRCRGNGASCQVCSGRGCQSCNYEAGKPCPRCLGKGALKAPGYVYNEKEPRRRGA